MVIATRLFRAVCYHPDIYQIITSGTDRKVGCFCLCRILWESQFGSLLRIVHRHSDWPARRRSPLLTLPDWTALFLGLRRRTRLHAPSRAAASFRLLRGEDVLRLFNAALSERARERESDLWKCECRGICAFLRMCHASASQIHHLLILIHRHSV